LAKFEIPLKTYAKFAVPVGNDKAQTFRTSDIQIANYTLDILVAKISASLYFSVEIDFITSSYVTGTVDVSGPVDQLATKDCTWTGTMPETITPRLSRTAFPGQSLDINVKNIQYHLTKMQMRLRSFTIGVGFSGHVLGIPYDEPNALEVTVPMSDFTPAVTIYSSQPPSGRASQSSGFLMDTHFSEPLDSFTVSVPVPATVETVFLNPIFMGIIIIAIVATSGVVVMRYRGKKIVTGADYYGCPTCGGPVWYQPQFHGWYCNCCARTVSGGPIRHGPVSIYSCPSCLNPVAWVNETKKWSCGHCHTNPSGGPIIKR
jgi:ribosomal protein L37AE/L43A